MNILCKIGLHLYKKVNKEINGHGQIIETHICSCRRERTDITWIMDGGSIVTEWSYFKNSEGKVIEETKERTYMNYEGDKYIDLTK
jgi:hypothetical protein